MVASAGSAAGVTLSVQGGICRQVLIRANTSTTVFRANLTDSNSVIRRNYGFHTGELNDMELQFPMAGQYTVQITNASPNDTFSVVVAVSEER